MFEKNSINFWLLTMLIIVSLSQPTQAALISNLSGNTHIFYNDGINNDILVNFAVFDKQGSTNNNSFGIPGALFDNSLIASGFDIASKYLYLYETTVVAGNSALTEIFVDGKLISSFGILTEYRFYNNDTPVGITLPNILTTLGEPCTGGSPAQACIGALTNPSIYFAGGGIPVILRKGEIVFGSSEFTPVINTGETSILWGYTSNYAPSFTKVFTCNSNDNCGSGIAVSASVPEPAILVLMSIGVAGIGFGKRRSRT